MTKLVQLEQINVCWKLHVNNIKLPHFKVVSLSLSLDIIIHKIELKKNFIAFIIQRSQIQSSRINFTSSFVKSEKHDCFPFINAGKSEF